MIRSQKNSSLSNFTQKSCVRVLAMVYVDIVLDSNEQSTVNSLSVLFKLSEYKPLGKWSTF